MAHRWYYEQLVGPIPEGLVLDHLCRVRLCINVQHLEPVTQAENVRRGSQRLSDENVQYIRAQGGLRPQKELADEFGISVHYVGKLQRYVERKKTPFGSL